MSENIAVDASAFTALLFGGPKQNSVAQFLGRASEVWVSSVTLVETGIEIAARKGDAGVLVWDALLQRLSLQVLPFTSVHAGIARDAWMRFGTGRHPANLSLSDCCAYATAHFARVPLLCVGDRFAKTDAEIIEA
jgi:ribonuclease VapC